MYLHRALHGVALWATVVSAFIPYTPPNPSAPGVDGPDTVWKSLKIPRNAEAFQLPPDKPVDLDSMEPVKDMHIKRIPPPVCTLGIHHCRPA